MQIREANSSDWNNIWPIFEEFVSAGDTYAYPASTNKSDAEVIWLSKPRVTFVVEDEGRSYSFGAPYSGSVVSVWKLA